MRNALLRAMHREEGYSLVISMLLMAIMMVLLAVSLDAGSASLHQSSLSLQWSKALVVAEGGADAAVTLLGQSRTPTNSCAIGTSNVCNGVDGQYQVRWCPGSTGCSSSSTAGRIVVDSIGYYPDRANAQFAREVEITYEPIPSFKYALFSQTALSVANNMTVMGDIYSAGDITVGQGATVCGSVVSSGGGVTLVQQAQILQSYSTLGCSGKSGNVWTGGTGGITLGSTVSVAGSLKASNPSTATCSSSGTNYAIQQSNGSSTVTGTATACGKIDSGVSAATVTAGSATSQPVPVTFPPFTFDPHNYSSLTCYPTTTPITDCGSNDATDAVTNFNAWLATQTSLHGTYAVWQRTPSSSTAINLSTSNCSTSRTLSGDFTLITNAPVNFGNTCTFASASGTASADMYVVSTYQPTGSCTAQLVQTGGADCSVYGQNAIEFDSGDQTNPDDGVVGLLYTTGKMAFVNSSNNVADVGDGALYAQSMDFKNGFNVIYNPRVERVLGFGASYEQVLWQEKNI
jgi:hypothetical protein